MDIRITCKHCEVPEPAKARAASRIEKLVRYDPRLASAEVVFSEEGRAKRVEAVLSIHGADQVFAKAEEDNFSVSVDRLVDRLSTVLRRGREQRVEHRGIGSNEPE